MVPIYQQVLINRGLLYLQADQYSKALDDLCTVVQVYYCMLAAVMMITILH